MSCLDEDSINFTMEDNSDHDSIDRSTQKNFQRTNTQKRKINHFKRHTMKTQTKKKQWNTEMKKRAETDSSYMVQYCAGGDADTR